MLRVISFRINDIIDMFSSLTDVIRSPCGSRPQCGGSMSSLMLFIEIKLHWCTDNVLKSVWLGKTTSRLVLFWIRWIFYPRKRCQAITGQRQAISCWLIFLFYNNIKLRNSSVVVFFFVLDKILLFQTFQLNRRGSTQKSKVLRAVTRNVTKLNED